MNPEINENGNKKGLLETFEQLKNSAQLVNLSYLLERIKDYEGSELGNSASEASAHIILKNLENQYKEIPHPERQFLAKLMYTLHPGILSEISKNINHDDSDVRFNFLQIVCLLTPRPLVKPILLEMIEDTNDMVRATAVANLRHYLDINSISFILKVLKDHNARVVANALETLESIPSTKTLPIFIRYINHPNNRVRANALKVLWQREYPEAYEYLYRMVVNQPDFLMRASACWVMGECTLKTNAKLSGLLKDCLEDTDQLVRKNALRAQLKIARRASKEFLSKHESST